MVTLLVRNRQVGVDLPPELKGKDIVRTRGLWNLEAEKDDGRAPFFANAAALHKDDEGDFVWKVEELKIDDLARAFDPVFRVRKVRVKLGSRQLRFMQVFSYRQLEDLGTLDPKTDLLAENLPDGVKDGDTVFLSRKRWLLRPGQIVKVDLQHGRLPEGFYVPAQSVIADGDGHHVYVVKEETSGEGTATRVDVRLGANIGAFQAIEPVNEGTFADGAKLIVDGVHYLHDGDPVNAFQEVEATL